MCRKERYVLDGTDTQPFTRKRPPNNIETTTLCLRAMYISNCLNLDAMCQAAHSESTEQEPDLLSTMEQKLSVATPSKE